MKSLRNMAKGVREWISPPPAAPEGLQLVRNATRGTTLATRLEKAHTGATRRKGLLGRDCLLPGEGLWIAPCESVHTFFMRFPIDLVYLDRKLKVKKVRHSVGAWRFSACLSAFSVLELPAGTAKAARTERGDTMEIGPGEEAEIGD
jgi:uncharacterized protein